MKKIVSIIIIFLSSFAINFFSIGKELGGVQAQSISSIEYFFDTDPGNGKGVAIQLNISDSTNDSLIVPISGLKKGFHYLFIRAQDTIGTWSMYDEKIFFIQDTMKYFSPPFKSSSAEYFYDIDSAGIGKSKLFSNLTPGDSISDTLLSQTNGLGVGFHKFYVRVKDSSNVWSFYEGGKIYLVDTIVLPQNKSYPLTSAEYFFDSDPGIGQGIALTKFSKSDSVLRLDTISTSSLAAGIHNLYFRVCDSLNKWSLYEGASFNICRQIPAPNFSADTVCLNTYTHLKDISTKLDSSSSFTYRWDFNGDHITDDTTRGNTKHIFPTIGTHSVTLIINNTKGCSDTITKAIYIDSLPTASFHLPVDTICMDDTLTILGGTPSGGMYSGSGVHNGKFYADSVSKGYHTITYTYYNTNLCSAIATDVIFVNYCTGITEQSTHALEILISPNPFNESTTINIRNTLGLNTNNLLLNIYNLYGEKIRETQLKTFKSQIFKEGLSSGIYFIKIISEKTIIGSSKLIIVD